MFDGTRFTVKFNGEFFIADADRKLDLKEFHCDLHPVTDYDVHENRIVFGVSEEWARSSVAALDGCECSDGNLMIWSQAMRLKKQLEFGHTGVLWDGAMYDLAKNILYFLHTKSRSIRLSVVKKCAAQYNKIQRRTHIPEELLSGYMNALSRISHDI